MGSEGFSSGSLPCTMHTKLTLFGVHNSSGSLFDTPKENPLGRILSGEFTTAFGWTPPLILVLSTLWPSAKLETAGESTAVRARTPILAAAFLAFSTVGNF